MFNACSYLPSLQSFVMLLRGEAFVSSKSKLIQSPRLQKETLSSTVSTPTKIVVPAADELSDSIRKRQQWLKDWVKRTKERGSSNMLKRVFAFLHLFCNFFQFYISQRRIIITQVLSHSIHLRALVSLQIHWFFSLNPAVEV